MLIYTTAEVTLSPCEYGQKEHFDVYWNTRRVNARQQQLYTRQLYLVPSEKYVNRSVFVEMVWLEQEIR